MTSSKGSIPDPGQGFLPEDRIPDVSILRRDYEKLRIIHELQRDIGLELDLDRILDRILDRTFDFLNCDRGAVLMMNGDGLLVIRAVKTRNPGENLIISKTMVRQVKMTGSGLIAADALADKRFRNAQSILAQRIRASMGVPIRYRDELIGILIIDSSHATDAYQQKDLQLLTNIANQTAYFIKNADMAQRIEADARTRARFERLLSPNLAEMVVSGELKVEKGGEDRNATVLFADIRGFTAMSERMPAAAVLRMLNDLFEIMVAVVFRHEGTVDKFVGDMIMVIWGAPVSHEDDPCRAVRAAVEMQEAIDRFNAARAAYGKEPIHVGIGINTGHLVAGYIGSTRTMSYSVIGRTVNLAARLCSAAGPGQILVSEATRARLGDRFETESLAPIQAKGIRHPVNLFQIIKGAAED